jgi:hypothetical protein
MEPEAPDFLDSQARWLAACMARESARADRMLNDPYASHLAGVAGARLFEEQTDDGRAFAAVLAVAVADDLVHRAVVDHRLHSVLHLGAGLDTRPYRLGLPNDLRWVELDLDAVFLYKIFRLAHVAPTCRVERVSVDVTDVAQRTGALRRATHGVARGLLLTEHLLDRFTLGALKELSTRIPGGLKWWILGTPRAEPVAQDDAIAAICGTRWKVADRRLLAHEAQRLAPGRHTPFVVDPVPAGDAESVTATIWLLRRVA